MFGVLKFNFYLANLHAMLEQIQGLHLFGAFTILFPASGFVSPLLGALFDAGRPRAAIAIMNSFSLLHVATAATTAHWVQYVSFAGVGLHRSALFGGLPQYIAFYFPPEQLGTLMGISTFCGGLMTGGEYLLTWMVVRYGERRFREVCAIFAVLTGLWYAFPVLMRSPPMKAIACHEDELDLDPKLEHVDARHQHDLVASVHASKLGLDAEQDVEVCKIGSSAEVAATNKIMAI
eukprot:TRINITY_DN32175_c0_g1_i2.p1 TRINITY_DN32175_c0_g1~~TRINITY_DN32175_c0_g1_i2.p1  ORF type:complete len:234 (+),score=7.62 TRINITY_DN32175_c0_g1_i2:184-885(+)